MPKNTLKSKQFNRVLSANKIKFKDGSSIELIGIQTEKIAQGVNLLSFNQKIARKHWKQFYLMKKCICRNYIR